MHTLCHAETVASPPQVVVCPAFQYGMSSAALQAWPLVSTLVTTVAFGSAGSEQRSLDVMFSISKGLRENFLKSKETV